MISKKSRSEVRVKKHRRLRNRIPASLYSTFSRI